MKQEKNDIQKKIDRYLDDLYTREEVDVLQKELQSKENLEYLDTYSAKLWDESLASYRQTIQEDEQNKREAKRLIHRIQKKTFSIRPFLNIAACLAVVAMLSWGIMYIRNIHPDNKELITELYVAYGDKKEIKLSDGSTVILNAGTSIKYPVQFKGKERRVELSGEAFFRIAKDTEHPFIVTTKELSVKVLGTEFNMKVYNQDERAVVSVKSGKVEVETDNVISRLTAGEQILVNTISKDYEKGREDFSNVSSWIKGGLFFKETPIGDVIKELERIYDCTIRFENNQLFDNLIIGEHDNKSVESVLKSIEYTTGIKYRKDGQEFVLYK